MAAVLERQRLVALYEFNPSVMLAEGQWPFSRQKPLAVNVGEVLEVVYDDGSAWVFCQKLGPEAPLGYVPKDYTVSVSEYEELLKDFENQEAEGSEAAKGF
ncbi:Abnormal spindle-like microcephaly-associated protein [Durusdinium trenchii]|uniref:Abnormal spindle-like microcephaly-associated protein n=1 Tax=Durusdinium trenchii TaxID=1381693 RepID=A0ABP0KAR8_9DINO